jgi:ribonuclease T1
VKRTWFLHCLIALCVALGGCGKGEQGRETLEPAAAASAAAGVQALSIQPDASVAPRTQEARQGEADGLGTVTRSQLPKQAVETLQRIEAGGPFPFEKDGVVFGNRERLLPPHPRGYYHEYTVPTPRARNRGARRIVCGGPRRQIDDCYYSGDHYASFKRIAG